MQAANAQAGREPVVDDSAPEAAVVEIERALLELADVAQRVLCAFALNDGAVATAGAVRRWYAHAAHRAAVESLSDKALLWTERLRALLGPAMTLRSPTVGPLPSAVACLLACSRAFTRCAALRDGFRWVGHPWVAAEVAHRPAAFLGPLTESTIATWAPSCPDEPLPSPVCAAAAALLNAGLSWGAVHALLGTGQPDTGAAPDAALPATPEASEADVVAAELTASLLAAVLLLVRRALRRAPTVPVYEAGGSLYTTKPAAAGAPVPLVVFGADAPLAQVLVTDEGRLADEAFRNGADELPVPGRDFAAWDAPLVSRSALGIATVIRLPDPDSDRSDDHTALAAGTACSALPREVRIGAQSTALRAMVLAWLAPALAVTAVRHGDPQNAAARLLYLVRPGSLAVAGTTTTQVGLTERALGLLVDALSSSDPAVAFRPIVHDPVAAARRLGGLPASVVTVIPLDLAPIGP